MIIRPVCLPLCIEIDLDQVLAVIKLYVIECSKPGELVKMHLIASSPLPHLMVVNISLCWQKLETHFEIFTYISLYDQISLCTVFNHISHLMCLLYINIVTTTIIALYLHYQSFKSSYMGLPLNIDFLFANYL